MSTSLETPAFDAGEFRRALGSFATGVTVITARSTDGRPVGLTANSFNSVSLDPPLVLWSLAKNALSRPAFEAATHWAVHVLAADQEALSARFARRGDDKFADLPLTNGIGSAPLLENCAARFQCRTAFRYDGGDHVIFVGEVLDFERRETAPLVFHAGRYALAAQKSSSAPRAPELPGGFDEHFLGYLMGRSHFQFYRGLRASLDEAGLDDDDYFMLSTLSVREGLTADELEDLIGHCLTQPPLQALRALLRRGLLDAEIDGEACRHYRLNDAGKALALRLFAQARNVEARIVERFGESDSAALRSLLHRLVTLTQSGNDLWSRPAASSLHH